MHCQYHCRKLFISGPANYGHDLGEDNSEEIKEVIVSSSMHSNI